MTETRELAFTLEPEDCKVAFRYINGPHSRRLGPYESTELAQWIANILNEAFRLGVEHEQRIEALESLLATFKAADEERLQETYDAQREAEKWKAEGDMYGWNFHQGMSSGTTHASIIFFRVLRQLEEMITAAKHLRGEIQATQREEG